jgi:hypothetical protein
MDLRSRTRTPWLVFVLGLAGCSAIVNPDTRKLEPQPVACMPGEVANCPCGDSWSMQVCNAGGAFDPCMCGGNGGGGADTGSGGSGGSAGSGASGSGGTSTNQGNGRGRGSSFAPAGEAGSPPG